MNVKLVMFACVRNAGRSQMAAAIFNRLADPEQARAVSAGTDPGPQVYPEVVTALGELGIDVSAARPQRLTAEVAAGAIHLVTMGCGDACPIIPGATRDEWPIPNPQGRPLDEVRAIRDNIAQRVDSLVRAQGWSRPE